MSGPEAAAVRADWERRIYRRLTDTAGADPALALPAPAGVRAEPAAGHIRLSWDLVPGAAGYVIERTGEDGDIPRILDHGGSDVPAVAGPPFADTGIADGTDYRYRVGAVSGAEFPVWEWSEAVMARTAPAAGPVTVAVSVDASAGRGRLDRVWRMVGAERLSQLRLDGEPREHGEHGEHGETNEPGARIATEFAAALRLARTDLGASMVRAHAILHDDNAVARRDQKNGGLSFSFDRIDAIYDQLLEIGLRPVVELSFMPAALARDPEQTVFTYRGIISPPADWAQWRQLVTALAAHLVQRYGIDEVARWAFEVWNEPNLQVFWPGTKAEYLRLYDESAKAIRAVSPRLLVGGPATAAGEWVESLAAHAERGGVPLDFVSTHTYGNLPLDVGPALRRHGFAGIPVWWTEWGVGSTHFGPVHDGVLGAPFVLSGYRAAQRRLDALAYWVISDHFEELGRPTRLFHNGFGLLTVGNLRKPRYWAVHLAEHLGDHLLAANVDGDGAEVLVRAWAARHAEPTAAATKGTTDTKSTTDTPGTVDVLVWNGTINAALAQGEPRLDRHIQLTVTGLGADNYHVELARVDEQHSNVAAHCPADVAWPDEARWAHLRAHDELYTERLPDVRPAAGPARFEFDLPMPGIARIRLSPDRATAGAQ
jgi:xylan 1,4-beta-xylosidase